jgi:hypothetical protein
VLALTLFGSAAKQWSGFAAAAAAAAADAAAAAGLEPVAWSSQEQQQQQQAVLLPPGVQGVLLPEPFLRQYKFPFRAVPVAVAVPLSDRSSCQGTSGEPATAVTEHQQHRWVRQLVEQQLLLQLAGNNPAAGRAMLTDCLPPAASHLSQRVLSATANQLFYVDAAAVAQRLLAAVQASGSHAECEQALQQLEQLASSHQGLLAIAAAGSTSSSEAQDAAAADASIQDCSIAAGSGVSCSWQSAFERLLAAAPINREDQRLWLRLLQLLERMLAAAPLPEVRNFWTLMYLVAAHYLLLRCSCCLINSCGCNCGNALPCTGCCSCAAVNLARSRRMLAFRLKQTMQCAFICVQVQYTHLQVLLQQSVSAWLQQPAASKEVPRPPLALAMGTNSWELLKQQPTSASAAAAVADMLGLNTANSKDAGAVATAASGPEASSDRLLALQVSQQALRVLLQLVKAVKRSCCQVSIGSNTGHLLIALHPAELLQLLCSRLLARGEEADYCCRALAGALLHEVTGALQDTAQIARLQESRESKGTSSKPAAAAAAALAVAAAAPGSCSYGLSNEAAAVVDAIEPLVTKVLMPVAGRAVPGFRGKALVRAALQALLSVVRGPVAAQEDWSQVWAAVGGTFWLSR